jgi:hypothetical protein
MAYPQQQAQPQQAPQQPQQPQNSQQAKGNSVIDGPWLSGCDSYSDTTTVGQGYYRWLVNGMSRGGLPRTRTGNNCIPVSTIGFPRGLTVFTPNSGIPHLVVAIGSQILKCPYPFTSAFTAIPGLTFQTNNPVVFKSTIQNVTEATDGTLTVIDPLNVLMICQKDNRTGYWDGTNARHLDPTKAPNGPSETPSFEWMEWSGNRLWGSQGGRLRASNLENPLKFTEEDILAEGGALTLPDDITGITRTPDFKNLIVFTAQTTSSVQSNILHRPDWQITPGFQTEIFPNIGCASGKSPITQYGVTWWFSHGGLMSIDQALSTYRTSRIHFEDNAMQWSKTNLSPDISGICCGSFENYLMVATPSGDRFNAHTWVMDQAYQMEQAISDFYSFIRAPTWNGLWTGIRPVEFVTAVIHGRQRCFALSYDYPADGSTQAQNNVWELFVPERIDVGRDKNGATVQKRISSSLETKVLSAGDYKDFRYIEIDCEDISGVVDITISYAPLRGGYKQVQTKKVVASQWNVVNGQTTIAVDTFSWNSYRPQSRFVRAQNEFGVNDSSDKNYEGVESLYPRQTDHGFSVLIEWTGQMSIRYVRLITDSSIQDPEGKVELDETTDRHVQMSGFQGIDTTAPVVLVDGLDLTSEFVSSNTRRWVEHFYSSMS